MSSHRSENGQEIQIPISSEVVLEGNLNIQGGKAIVVFAHGSGSGRHSPRNRNVAAALQEAGLGTFLFDLLTEEEEVIDEQTRQFRFDIELLADRLTKVAEKLLQMQSKDENNKFRIGYFGASTGAAAALIAAAKNPDIVHAIVSRGGRPDLAEEYLDRVNAPTLLIVGENDEPVIKLNHGAFGKLRSLKDDEKRLTIVPGATHLFEEPGKLEQVAQLAAGWFSCFLGFNNEEMTTNEQDHRESRTANAA